MKPPTMPPSPRTDSETMRSTRLLSIFRSSFLSFSAFLRTSTLCSRVASSRDSDGISAIPAPHTPQARSVSPETEPHLGHLFIAERHDNLFLPTFQTIEVFFLLHNIAKTNLPSVKRVSKNWAILPLLL